MTIAYIASRSDHDKFKRTMVMWKWCEDNFGPGNHDQDSWCAWWADDTDNWIKFTFYNEAIAPWFILMFPEVMSENQFKWRDFEPADWKEIQ